MNSTRSCSVDIIYPGLSRYDGRVLKHYSLQVRYRYYHEPDHPIVFLGYMSTRCGGHILRLSSKDPA